MYSPDTVRKKVLGLGTLASSSSKRSVLTSSKLTMDNAAPESMNTSVSCSRMATKEPSSRVICGPETTAAAVALMVDTSD